MGFLKIIYSALVTMVMSLLLMYLWEDHRTKENTHSCFNQTGMHLPGVKLEGGLYQCYPPLIHNVTYYDHEHMSRWYWSDVDFYVYKIAVGNISMTPKINDLDIVISTEGVHNMGFRCNHKLHIVYDAHAMTGRCAGPKKNYEKFIYFVIQSDTYIPLSKINTFAIMRRFSDHGSAPELKSFPRRLNY